ncbi:RarD protein [Xanthomonas fragariae LMG 25863]|nr:RarD protein [Xanthomonas fragariae LMG 25863]
MSAVSPIEARRGLLITAAAFVVWGMVPLYWHLLKAVPSLQIIAHRIVWSAVLVVALLLATSGVRWWREIAAQPRALRMLACSSVAIAFKLGAVYLGDQRRPCDRGQPGLLHQSAAERVVGRAGVEGALAPHPVGGGNVRGSGRVVVGHRCRRAAVDRVGAGVYVWRLWLAAQVGGGGSGGRAWRGKRVSVRAGPAAGGMGRAGTRRRIFEWLEPAHRSVADLRRGDNGIAADRVCIWCAADPTVAGGQPAIHRAEPAVAARRVVFPGAIRSGTCDRFCRHLGRLAAVRRRQRVAFAAAGCAALRDCFVSSCVRAARQNAFVAVSAARHRQWGCYRECGSRQRLRRGAVARVLLRLRQPLIDRPAEQIQP